ncbi:MAG TPA: histidine kinase [Clostridiaceae bacterium]
MNNKRRRLYLKFKRSLRYKDQPLLVQVTFIFVLIFIIMIMLSFINFVNYSNDKAKATLEVIDSMNGQILDKVDGHLENLSNITKLPLIYENNTNTFVNNLEMSTESNFGTLDFMSQLNKLFNDAFNYNSYIQSVFIFNMEGVFQRTARAVAMYPGYNPKEDDWFKKVTQKNGGPLIMSTFQLPYMADIKGNNVYVFSVSRAIVDVNNSKVAGVILINSNLNFLSKLFKKMLFIPDQRIAIIDENNNVVYDTKTNDIGKKFDKNLLKLTNNGKLKDKVIRINNSKFLVSCQLSNYSNWKIINIIPENQLNKSIYELRDTTILITFLLILLAMTLVLLFIRQIIEPIKKLVLMMKLIERGDFEVKIKLKNHNEIGELAKSFNNMVRKVNKLVKEVYIDKITQKELEIQMLQNQINPHFLYNTLESIHMMAEINEDEETSSMVRALGRILRYGISGEHDHVTIKQELDHLNDYIMLQKIRFSNIFDIQTDIDDTIYQNTMIKLILQPVVENSIYHGLENKLSDGLIEISGHKENDDIIFKITDNGVGMSEKAVNKMNDYINALDSSSKSIGLKNVNRRLKLYYGNNYGVKVYSELNVGTTVIIIIPINTNQININSNDTINKI